MYFYTGRFCNIEELSTDNEYDFFLFLLKNKLEYEQKVSNQIIPKEYSSYLQTMKAWFNNGRNYQFLVYNKKKILVGTIFFYAYNSQNKSIKISCYFSVKGKIIIGESIGAGIQLVCHHIHQISNIIFDVYTNNKKVLSLTKKIDAILIKKGIHSTTGSGKIIRRYLLNDVAIFKIISTFKRLTKRIT